VVHTLWAVAMTWLVVIFGLGLLVFLHELGHFSVARLVGIKPRAFYVGFPPALVKTERDGVEYGIGAIPLGGYVRIPGMLRPAAADFASRMEPARREEPTLGPFADVVQRRLEAEDWDGARAALPELEAALERTPPSASARRSAESAMREVDEGTGADAYWRQPIRKRLATIAAGPGMNVLVAFVLFFAVYVTGAPTGRATSEVASVEAGSPAASAGLRSEDRIVAVNGHATRTFEAVSHEIQSNERQPLTVTVVRDGQRVTLPSRRPVQRDGRWVWGFVPAPELESHPVDESAQFAARDCWRVVTGSVESVRHIFGESEGAQVTGPVGVVRTSEQALTLGIQWYLILLGVISMSLALFNLLPLLPLDGGHLLFALLESVRGRAMPRAAYERASQLGMALLLLVYVFAFMNDLGAVSQ
jgi:regulator of sigma E protease